MRVIYIGSYNESEILSGPEKVCKRIFSEYAENNESLFIEYFQDGKKHGILKKIFGHVLIGSINESKVLKLGIIKMLLVIFKCKPKYIHILSFNRFAALIFLLKFIYPVNIFYNVNGIIVHEDKLSNNKKFLDKYKNMLVENVLIYLSDKLFILSDMSKSILNKYYNTKGLSFTKIVNGLDACFLNENLRATNRITGSVVFVGDINLPYKGFDFLIKALEKITFRVNLFIVDSMNTKSRHELPYSVKVCFLKKMSTNELADFLKDKLIIISPSMYDAFNLTVLEAVACGLIPVLTYETGISEYFTDYYRHNIVKYGDINHLCTILENQLNSPNYNFNLDFNSITWKEVLSHYYIKHYV